MPPALPGPPVPPSSDEPAFPTEEAPGPRRSRKRARAGQPWLVIGLIVVLLVGITTVAVVWGFRKSDPQEEAIQVTADDLLDEFEENEIAFKRKYNGKLVEVTGFEQERHADEFVKGATVVTLAGKKKGRRRDTLNCHFLQKNKPGYFDHTTAVRGRCLAGEASFHLDDCQLTNVRRDYAPLRKSGSDPGAKQPRKGDTGKGSALTPEKLSRSRKAICDKYPQQGDKAKEEWSGEYRGKVLEITGTVELVGTRKWDSNSEAPVVVLKGDPNAIEFVDRPPSEGGSYQREGVSEVWFWFDPKRPDELTGVRVGQTVTLRGRFDSLSAYTVHLKDCSVLR